MQKRGEEKGTTEDEISEGGNQTDENAERVRCRPDKQCVERNEGKGDV